MVTGNGTPTRPYLVGLTNSDLSKAVVVSDTPTLDLHISGLGTPTSPLNIFGYPLTKMTDLKDVNDPFPPAVGEVPTWMGTHWEFQPPPGGAGGTTVSAGHGLGGNGSVGTPLTALTPSEWAVGELAAWAAGAVPATAGNTVYVDTAGNLRSRPQVWQPSTLPNVTASPSTYPLGMTILSVPAAQAGAAGWPGGGLVVTHNRYNDNVVAQWWHANSTTKPLAYYRSGNAANTPAWSNWVTVVEDTGWINITPSSGSGTLHYRGRNGFVELAGSLSGMTGLPQGQNGAVAPAGSIPTAYCPPATVYFATSTGGAGNGLGLVGPAGDISQWYNYPGSCTVFRGTTVWAKE